MARALVAMGGAAGGGSRQRGGPDRSPGRTGAGFADVERELERETSALQALADKEMAVAAVLEDARASREALVTLYQRGFSTQAERLTQLITEVKRLAQRAGLEPKSISYPEEALDEYGLVRMSLVFGVQGTYPQLRTLVNLLEHSDLFLVLGHIGLSNSNSPILGINLQLSTFFVRDPAALQAIEAPPPATPERGDGQSSGRELAVMRRLRGREKALLGLLLAIAAVQGVRLLLPLVGDGGLAAVAGTGDSGARQAATASSSRRL